MPFSGLGNRLASATTPMGRNALAAELRMGFIYGSGTVLSAEAEAEGGWYVEFETDPGLGDGKDVGVEVNAEDVGGQPLPEVGQDYRFMGRLHAHTGEGDAVEAELVEGLVGK